MYLFLFFSNHSCFESKQFYFPLAIFPYAYFALASFSETRPIKFMGENKKKKNNDNMCYTYMPCV